MGCNVKPRYRIFDAFLPTFFTEFNSPKIKSLKFWITELFAHFLKLWISIIFDDNLPNLTALHQLTAGIYRFKFQLTSTIQLYNKSTFHFTTKTNHLDLLLPFTSTIYRFNSPLKCTASTNFHDLPLKLTVSTNS